MWSSITLNETYACVLFTSRCAVERRRTFGNRVDFARLARGSRASGAPWVGLSVNRWSAHLPLLCLHEFLPGSNERNLVIDRFDSSMGCNMVARNAWQLCKADGQQHDAVDALL